MPSESEPHAGGDVDGLGRGSKPGRCCACIRPPSQPVLQTAPSQRLASAAGVLGPQDPSTSGRRPCPAARGKCSFPRAGAAAGRAWVQWTQHTCRRVEPLARRGLQDRLGWGSNAGTALAKFRPPPQPSPCPGAGARSLVAGILGVRRSFTMWNVLFLMRASSPPSTQLRRFASNQAPYGVAQQNASI